MSATQAKICIYTSTEDPGDTRLTTILTPHLTSTTLNFKALGDLLIHLKSPATTEDVVLLGPRDARELSDFVAHKRLQDRRLVLVLPDAEEATLSLAHLLAPRYLCFIDDIGTDLAAVLNKMVANPRLSTSSQGAVG